MVRQMLAAGLLFVVLSACSSTPASTPPTAPPSATGSSTSASSLPLVDGASLQSCGQLMPLVDEYLNTTGVTDFEEFADSLVADVLPGASDALAPLIQELARTARLQPDETEIPSLLEAMQAVYGFCGLSSGPG